MNIITNIIWKSSEKLKKNPKYLRKIEILELKDFVNIIKKKKLEKISEIITNLYQGDFYIIRNSLKNKEIEKLKFNLIQFSKKNKTNFFKMVEGCPNFWREIDEKHMKKYSFKVIKNAWYFFRWNKEKIGIWKMFSKQWSLVKILMGLKKNDYEKNTPKDKIVDRIQVVKYPANTGFCQSHWHSPKNQRLVISYYLSEIKKDYSKGGTYFFNNQNKKIEVEKFIKKGDMGIFYSTLFHGVDPVKIIKTKLSKKDYIGRWWCGLYSPESNEVNKRTTSKVV